MTIRFVLASTSPRRSELLRTLGIPFETISPLFKEVPTDHSVSDEALYFAEAKARSVAKLYPKALILGSDTLIELEGEKIGKPENDDMAREILKKLSGKTHRLYTAVVLLNTNDDSIRRHVEEVLITFREISLQEIEAYVATGEPIGKAGAYAIQGGGKKFAIDIKGDLQAVVGLPLRVIQQWLKEFMGHDTNEKR
ncbi:MAG: septum formation protein Maf [Deltaproteobacteria bacterium]|nr:septum formation protein Maf [Deltaproteobacteria bacterium]